MAMHILTGLSVGIALLAAPPSAEREAEVTQTQQVDKLHGELAAVLAGAAEGELIPVTIIMRDQAPPNEIQQASRLRDKAARRHAVKSILKAVADGSQKELLALLRAGQETGAAGPEIRSLWIHNVVGAEVTAELATQIAARPDVAYLNHNKKMGAELFPVEPPGEPPPGPSRAIECGVELMEAPRVWNELGITGRGAIICVIDTGCCIAHPDLENQIWTNPGEIPGNHVDDDGNGFVDDINGWNFESNNNNINDTYGHGTHVSGTVAGDGTNGETTGMAPDCAVMTCKFWNNFGGEQTVWDGMQYAVDNGAHVTTASLGWPHMMNPDRPTWRAICENTIAAGLVVVYAAGNEDGWYSPVDNVRTPGDVPDVVTVGATDCSDNLAGFSSTGPVTWQNIPPYNDWPYPPGKIKPSICAPGVDTLSTSIDNNCTTYEHMSGTSMATPHVAGAVALILEANPYLDHHGVKDILMNTALDLGPDGFDNQFGMGRVNAYEAVLEALASLPCPGDLDGDGDTDQSDLGVLLADWGCTSGCVGDLDGDDDTDQEDLGILLADYGCTP